MWPAEGSSSSNADQKEDVICASPFEGGESLCEFYVECSGCTETNVPSTKCYNELEPHENHQSCVNGFSTPDPRLPNKNLFSFFNQDVLPVNTFTQTFLQSILSSVDSHDPVVANAWVETLLDVIDLLPKDIIKNEILTLAINKGQMSQPISSRLLCCRMLGKLCTKFDPYVIKKQILPIVLSLCQDVDYEVRGCICRQLDVVAKGIGLEAAKNAILPELVELSNDEESFVRLAGIETIVLMLPLLDDDACTQAIVPLVQKFCENSLSTEDSTLPVVAMQFGKLCHGLTNNLTAEQKLWFLQFFRNLANMGLPYRKEGDSMPGFYSPMPDLVPELENKDRQSECRFSCAYNFPAMVLFAEPNNFPRELHETFSNLCVDPYLNVKKTMSSGFFEVVKLLGPTSTLLFPELILFLNDNSLEILKGVIPHLPEILSSVFKPEWSLTNVEGEKTDRLVQAIISCEVTTSISSNWRLHAQLLTQMSNLSKCLSPDIIYMHFVPLLLVKLYSARPIPCRTAAACSLLVLLRHTPKLDQRNGIVEELVRDLCFGRSCHKRMLFIKICDLVLEMFSKAFFKQHFFIPVLNLCGDSVPNIRLRMCSLLPKLKNLMKLPKDGALLQKLESCVRKLMTEEKDHDVVASVSKAIEELDKIEVPTEMASKRLSLDVESTLLDFKKEREENRIISLKLCTENPSQDAKEFVPSEILTRHGKIPVRKSGTLPKPTKAKEFKSNTLTRNTLHAPLSKRGSKCLDNKVSSSPLAPSKLLNSMKKDNVKEKGKSKYPQKNNVFPTKPQIRYDVMPQHHVQQEVRKTWTLLDRCPSPMPRNIVPPTDKPAVSRGSFSPLSTRSASFPNAAYLDSRSIRETVNRLTPSPSMEISKRPSQASRIPTPTLK